MVRLHLMLRQLRASAAVGRVVERTERSPLRVQMRQVHLTFLVSPRCLLQCHRRSSRIGVHKSETPAQRLQLLVPPRRLVLEQVREQQKAVPRKSVVGVVEVSLDQVADLCATPPTLMLK
jgi:hypothetical protein